MANIGARTTFRVVKLTVEPTPNLSVNTVSYQKILLLLLLRWHYSPMRIFASFRDVSQSAVS
jgi:hypothetical protein